MNVEFWKKKFCICCDYRMIFSFAILGYLSFYQTWVKRSRSYVHGATHAYFKWWGLMNSKRMNMKFRRPKGDALGHNIWRASTSLVNWVLIMPLVHLTKPEDGGWEAQDKCCKTSQTAQICKNIWPVKWVPQSPESLRGLQDRIIFFKRT